MRYIQQTRKMGRWITKAHPTAGESTLEGVYERIWAKKNVRFVDTETGKILDTGTLKYNLSG